MGVVELDGDFLGEGFPVFVVALEAADDVAERAGDEEVLLEQAEFLAGLGVVVRVKHLRDRFGGVFLPDGLLVAAAIERIEIKLGRGFRFPESQEVHRLGAVAGDRNVVGNADDFAVVHPLVAGLARGVGDGVHAAVNGNFLDVLGTDDFPRRAVLDPGVGEFDLVAVAELLFEKTVFVVDAVADRREVERGERIKETSGETAEAAVAEGHVVFLVAGFLKSVTEVFQSLDGFLENARVDHVVRVEATHEKLHREVVNAADISLGVNGEGFHHAVDDNLLDGLGSGDPPIALGSGRGVAGEAEVKLIEDFLLEAGGGLFLFFHGKCGNSLVAVSEGARKKSPTARESFAEIRRRCARGFREWCWRGFRE